MHVQPLKSSTACGPIVMTPVSDTSRRGLCEYLATNRPFIDNLVRENGGVLFRGFALVDATDFRACAESLGAVPFNYIGGNTPRSRVAADIFTATEFPATETIALHNEMSYLPEWPRRLFFYSLIPAATGGQTSLASSRDVLLALPADIVRRFEEKQVTYIRHFHSNQRIGKSWQATYQTEDKEAVERIVCDQGSTCQWLPDGVLRVKTRCHAVIRHPDTQEQVWFNQAEQWHPSALSLTTQRLFEELLGRGRMPHDCEYGDGDPFEENVLAEIRRTLLLHKRLVEWRANDLLAIDNILTMHGRESFTGERQTLAYLSTT